MKSVDLLGLFWIIGLIIPLLIAGAYWVLFGFFERSQRPQRFFGLLFSSVLLSTVLWFCIVYFIGSGFGPGTPLCISSLVAGIVLSILLSNRKSRQDDALPKKLLSTTKFILSLSFILPPIVSCFTWHGCDAYHRHIANDVIQVMDSYNQTNNNYPDDLDALLPTYLPEIPIAICLQPYKWIARIISPEPHLSSSQDIQDYYLCALGEQTYLAVDGTALGFTQLYDFERRQWLTIDFLDEECVPAQ